MAEQHEKLLLMQAAKLAQRSGGQPVGSWAPSRLTALLRPQQARQMWPLLQ